jgi:hypothetical protein
MEYKTFASEIGLTEKFGWNQHEVHFDQTSENLAQILPEIITRYSMQDSLPSMAGLTISNGKRALCLFCKYMQSLQYDHEL